MHILIADDHSMLREALKDKLSSIAENAVIVTAATLDEAIARITPNFPPDLILLDLDMPGMNGLSGIRLMLERAPLVPIVIVSGHIDRSVIMNAIESGARGYIPKTMTSAGMINALRLVLAGETYLPSLLGSSFSRSRSSSATANGVAPSPSELLLKLTEVELRVLRLIVEGYSSRELATVLNVAEAVINTRTRSLYRKLGAEKKADAVRIAIEHGMHIE